MRNQQYIVRENETTQTNKQTHTNNQKEDLCI